MTKLTNIAAELKNALLIKKCVYRLVVIVLFVYCNPPFQFVIFKPLSFCFKETIGFHVKASFASRPVSRLIN